MAAKTISGHIIELAEEYARNGVSLAEINSGYCADFATVICERLPGLVRVLSDDDFGREYTHTFIKCGLMFYDAECPLGVDEWQQLPVFGRQ